MKPILIFIAIIVITLVSTFAFQRFKGSSEKAISSTGAPLGQEVTHCDIRKKQVTFTFDGGSTIESGQKILEVLKKHNVKGTFFLTGKFILNYPDFVKQIAKGGHEIFNHTYDHKDLTKLSDNEIAL